APPQPARPAAAALHPGTQRVLLATSRLVALLRAAGEEELAGDFRTAGRRLATDETAGLYGLQALFRRLRETSLRDARSQARLRQLAVELRQAVVDRAEQLELLPFG
ncbi:MAG TPA: hypothetical protein VK131_07190, partial [Candidatus Acidoferrales bacterium]|nr:hypothetical protein [Candidatus Acidoferrales bacterium]